MNTNRQQGQKKKVLLLGLAAVVVNETLKATKRKRKRTREWIARRNEVINREKEANNTISLLKYQIAAENPYDYRNYMRMNEGIFKKLLEILKPHISRQDTVLRQAIPASDRLIATLRYLATGEKLKTLALYMKIPHNTLSVIIKQVLEAIVDTMAKEFLKVPNTTGEWKDVAIGFERLWNFPHCVGAMDGKHLMFRNYKNTDSIVLLAVVDAHHHFLMVDIGTHGRISDEGVFSRSSISSALESNDLNLPPDSPLPERNMNIPYVLVADGAFPLKEYIMKPYQFHGLSNEQRIYNYRVSRARRLVESAFGILCNRFQIFLQHMNLSVEKAQLITYASVILHNFLAQTCTDYTDKADVNFDLNLESIVRQNYGNRTSNREQAIRQEFQEYFNTNGAVPWQQDYVNHHNL